MSEAPAASTVALEGVPLSRGIAIGEVHVLTSAEQGIPQYFIGKGAIKEETARFRQAVAQAEEELKAVRRQASSLRRSHPSITAFVDLYLALIGDETISKRTEDLIAKRLLNAEWALQVQTEELSASFDALGNHYLRERKHDIEHAAAHIIRAMSPANTAAQPSAQGAGAGKILVAKSISPTQVLECAHRGYLGLATEIGGPNSHAAIIARSLRLPFLGRVPKLLETAPNNAPATLDAVEGTLTLWPAGSLVASLTDAKKALEARQRAKPGQRHPARIRTKDKVAVSLQANIELVDEIGDAVAQGASEIGLFRTESLILSLSDIPSEDEQYEMYRDALKEAQGLPITFRTLDIGGDKALADPESEQPLSSSPLGLRAIRFCLSNPEVFLCQLRALMRAAHHGPARVMFPMLTHPAELTQALGLVDLAREQLSNRGVQFGGDVPVGGMLEVPASVFVMEDFSRRLDFFSVGTNDLIQYMLAVDRDDEELATLNDPLHPAIIRMLTLISRKAKESKRPVTVCGEMAGDRNLTRLLLCLGLTRLSMQSDRLAEVREVVANTSTKELKRLAKGARKAETPEQVARVLGEHNQD